MDYILNKYDLKESIKSIGNMHGKIIEVNANNKILKILPLYQPAACIYNIKIKDILIEDFSILKSINV